MLTPGPDHPITIKKSPHRLRVTFNRTVVAESANALELREASYPPVFYIPRADARMEYFERSEHTSRCPYKGGASYFSLEVAGKRAENAVWTYETPYPVVEEIKEYVAFYPYKVDAIEEIRPNAPCPRSGVSARLASAFHSNTSHWKYPR